jgi:hypothetical protein
VGGPAPPPLVDSFIIEPTAGADLFVGELGMLCQEEGEARPLDLALRRRVLGRPLAGLFQLFRGELGLVVGFGQGHRKLQ